MEAIAERPREGLAPAQEITGGLFLDFVSWIDRGEKTTRSYITNLRQFMAWLKYRACSRPERADILSYKEWLANPHKAIQLDPEGPSGWKYRTDRSGCPLMVICRPNTIAQYLRSVCQFFRWTAASGIYPDIAANIHAPKIKHDTHRKEALTPADVLSIECSIAQEAQELTAAAAEAAKDTKGRVQRSTEQGKRLRALYLLAVNAGLRTVELSRANIKDLETRNGQSWLYIWGKGHSEPDQKKPLAPEVAEAIREYIAIRSDHPTGASPLFVATGNRSGGRRLDPVTISKLLKQALRAAGFDSERLTAHSLRHTAGTAVMELTGRNVYTTQQYMRHSNPATTEIYLHTSTENAEATIAQQLYNLYHGTAQPDNRAKLESIIDRMTPEQQEQLANIAAAMGK